MPVGKDPTPEQNTVEVSVPGTNKNEIESNECEGSGSNPCTSQQQG